MSCHVLCLCQADVGLAATIGAMDAANAVAVEWGLGASTPGVLDEVRRKYKNINRHSIICMV